jgi:hypothetical protein
MHGRYCGLGVIVGRHIPQLTVDGEQNETPPEGPRPLDNRTSVRGAGFPAVTVLPTDPLDVSVRATVLVSGTSPPWRGPSRERRNPARRRGNVDGYLIRQRFFMISWNAGCPSACEALPVDSRSGW